jgi:uncharacterized protein (DUF1697 family)
MKPEAYVAFLRGINVGGNALIKMAELKRAFESLGFARVTTVLASGNVVFEAAPISTKALQRKIQEKLQSTFDANPLVILRSGVAITSLIKTDPFKSVKLTDQTKLHVTFLSEASTTDAEFPIEWTKKPFRVVQVGPGEICSVVEPTETSGTSELMSYLEKQFGKNLTTRTWNTILKIGSLVQT